MSTTYEQHHLGRFLPPIPEEDFKRLCADIAAHGLLEAIVLYQGKILDGWSRYRACQYARVEPRYREFAGDNPVAHVLSKNVHRRHLNPVQILKILEAARPALEAEAVARKRANLKHMERIDAPNLERRGRVAEQIAQIAGVSPNTAYDYHAVQVHGSAELKEAVDREEVSISDAAQVARSQSPQGQTAAVERVRAGEASTLRQALEPQATQPPGIDALGLPIPDSLREAFDARSVFQEVGTCLSRARKLVGQIRAGQGAKLIPERDWQAIARELGVLRTQISLAEPYTSCPDCHGRGCRFENTPGTSLCRGSGYVSRRQHQRLASASKEEACRIRAALA